MKLNFYLSGRLTGSTDVKKENLSRVFDGFTEVYSEKLGYSVYDRSEKALLLHCHSNGKLLYTLLWLAVD